MLLAHLCNSLISVIFFVSWEVHKFTRCISPVLQTFVEKKNAVHIYPSSYLSHLNLFSFSSYLYVVIRAGELFLTNSSMSYSCDWSAQLLAAHWLSTYCNLLQHLHALLVCVYSHLFKQLKIAFSILVRSNLVSRIFHQIKKRVLKMTLWGSNSYFCPHWATPTDQLLKGLYKSKPRMIPLMSVLHLLLTPVKLFSICFECKR